MKIQKIITGERGPESTFIDVTDPISAAEKIGQVEGASVGEGILCALTGNGLDSSEYSDRTVSTIAVNGACLWTNYDPAGSGL